MTVNPSVADKQSQIKALIAQGKEKGFLTYAEVADHLPEIVDAEQIEDIISMIQAMGIPVHEEAPDTEAQLFAEPAVVATAEEEEDAAEEAITNATVDDQFGRTTDPVRMYMREMGSVELLNREGEIRIAKRIEEGLNEAMYAMAQYPETVAILLESFELHKAGKKRLAEIVTGFFDPNAEEAPPPQVLARGPRAEVELHGADGGALAPPPRRPVTAPCPPASPPSPAMSRTTRRAGLPRVRRAARRRSPGHPRRGRRRYLAGGG